MAVSYYPGCSLHGTAAEYDESLRAVCALLDIELVEIPDWSCCGASSAHCVDADLAIALPARNLALADGAAEELLVPCSACFQHLRRADAALRRDPGRWIEGSYRGEQEILHVNDFFARDDRLAALRTKAVRSLEGLAGVAYYGCLSQRPPRVTGAGSAENPTAMDRTLGAVGMGVLPWSYKTDCCGAGLGLTRPQIVHHLSGALFEAAREAGAECIVTDCPLCQSNLDARQAEIEALRRQHYGLPVFYVTELLGLALGEPRAAHWWGQHLVDPRPLLEREGLA